MKVTIFEIWTRSLVVEAESEAHALNDHVPEEVPGMTLSNWHAFDGGEPVAIVPEAEKP